jgi:hypothetical protein
VSSGGEEEVTEASIYKGCQALKRLIAVREMGRRRIASAMTGCGIIAALTHRAAFCRPPFRLTSQDHVKCPLPLRFHMAS